jgi:N-acetylneuraminic acid mutarotase
MPSKKEVEAAKKAARAAKQANKQAKGSRKDLAEAGEEDIEKLLAEIRLRDGARTAISVSVVPQPSRRSAFTLTALPNGDMLLFGGEFCDGQNTVVYNELFTWNLARNEWKQIQSPNTPPPRCSHQAVVYKDKLYVFGGEYATLDQFHHYRDLWSLDLKTNAWTELHPRGDAPSARSGHRMLVWRNFLILFGGFYEAAREVHWFNDLFFYSFAEELWTKVQYKPLAPTPRPRSGMQMVLHASEDVVFMCGGFSKEKLAGLVNEGYIHNDMWTLSLKPVVAGAGAGRRCSCGSGRRGDGLWQRARAGGAPGGRRRAGPTPR